MHTAQIRFTLPSHQCYIDRINTREFVNLARVVQSLTPTTAIRKRAVLGELESTWMDRTSQSVSLGVY
jgi:hypothetical protein